jgi:hypothetical protein
MRAAAALRFIAAAEEAAHFFTGTSWELKNGRVQ